MGLQRQQNRCQEAAVSSVWGQLSAMEWGPAMEGGTVLSLWVMAVLQLYRIANLNAILKLGEFYCMQIN